MTINERHFDKALEEFEKSHFSNAMYFFKKSLDNYYEQAMYYLGMMYELGLGTKDKQPNTEQAFICYYEAYNSGNEQAGKCFARVYEHYEDKLEYIKHKYPDLDLHNVYSKAVSERSA